MLGTVAVEDEADKLAEALAYEPGITLKQLREMVSVLKANAVPQINYMAGLNEMVYAMTGTVEMIALPPPAKGVEVRWTP